MQQIIAQTQASSSVALMFGDEKFLQKQPFLSSFQTLGLGKLVVAWPKGETSPVVQDFIATTRRVAARIAAEQDFDAPGLRPV